MPDMFIPPDGLILKRKTTMQERPQDEALRSVIFCLHKQKHDMPTYPTTSNELELWQDHALHRYQNDYVFHNDVTWLFNEVTRWFRKDQPR